MRKLLPENPDVTVELTIDYALADVVADRFDAGVRLGGEIAKDMIAVRISADVPMAIVGAPAYFAGRSAPASPAGLVDHRAINLGLPGSRAPLAWRLMRGGREAKVRVGGPLVLTTIELVRAAALDGHGLAYLPTDQVQDDLDAGRLIQVLGKFTPDLPGYQLYYPNRRHASAAFKPFVEAVRYRD